MDKADELIKELLADYKGPEDLIGADGLMKRLTKKLVEGAMSAEMTHHLGYAKHGTAGEGGPNARNGTSPKTLKGDLGQVQIDVPRDRDGSFEPKIVAKHQRRFTGFDDKILSMYARGMSTREIQGHLEEIYAIEVSPHSDLGSHRCRHRRSKAMAESAAGKPIPNPFPGCSDGEDAP